MRWRFAVILLAASAATAFAGEIVHDLGDVPKAIRQPEGRQSFAREIAGDERSDRLGTALPKGLSRETVVRLIAPDSDPSRILLVGAKPWQHPAGSYVAIVCAARPTADLPRPDAAPECEDSAEVFLGVAMLPSAGGPARLVARAENPLVPNSEWSPPKTAPILLPSVRPPDGWSAERADTTVTGFDLAPYRIAPHVYAFGIRSVGTEGYAGGYASFETLSLFTVDGASLRRVLAQPIYALAVLAGAWNKDGTRQHEVDEAKLSVSVLPSMTGGHYDLQVKQRGRKGHAVLRWNRTAAAYWVPPPQN